LFDPGVGWPWWWSRDAICQIELSQIRQRIEEQHQRHGTDKDADCSENDVDARAANQQA
jgi:hypothetical protein